MAISFDVEGQARIRGNAPAACACRAIAEGRRDDQPALTAHVHRGNAFVPTLDHSAGANGKLKRLIALARAVEDGPVVQIAGVVHDHGLALLWFWTGARYVVDVLQATRGCHRARGGRRSSGNTGLGRSADGCHGPRGRDSGGRRRGRCGRRRGRRSRAPTHK
jgi:hypothetical protein